MEVIDVPSLGLSVSLPFSLPSNYKNLRWCWFEEKYFDKNNYIHKSIILEINYNPDKIYNTTDGYYGRCWTAVILSAEDGTQKTYNFRNFADLVELFEKNGYIFVDV
jgi:hypothetical protein